MSEIEVGSEWRDDDSGLVARGERVKVVKVERYSVVIEAMDGELKGETWKLDRAWFLKKFSPVVPADAPPATPPHYDFAIEPCRACGDESKAELHDTDLEPSVRCMRCGAGGVRCGDAVEAVEVWNKAQEEQDVKTFASGAARSLDAESVRYDLVSPVGLRRLAETYAEGAEKYGPGNWLKGMPASDLLNHLLRHVDLYRSGDRDEDHLAHAAWGLFALMHFEETRPDLMDLVDFAVNPGADR